MSQITIPEFETDRLILRGPRMEDWPACDAFLTSNRSAFVGGPVGGLHNRWKSFAQLVAPWVLRGYGSFVMERRDTGAAIGAVGPFHPVRWPEPELAWSVWSAGSEGKGYVTEAMRPVHDWVFDSLGWPTCVSYVDVGNHRSAAVARNLGAEIDPDAPLPKGDDPAEVHVWRHRKGAAR